MHAITKVAFSILLVNFVYFLNILDFKQSLLLSVILLLTILFRTKSNGPPGPFKLPIFGCLYVIFKSDPQDYIKRLHYKYGPIMDISIGSQTLYSIGDYELIKEIGLHPDFQLRPDNLLLNTVFKNLGIIAAEGQFWKHQRRFVLHALRDSGMGKLKLQEKIQDELKIVVEKIDEFNGNPMSVYTLLEKSTCNIIFSLAFNKRFDYESQDFIAFINAINENFKLSGRVAALGSSKLLQPFADSTMKKFHHNYEIFMQQSQEFIEEHRQTFDGENPRDLLDLYLKEMQNNSGDDEEYHNTFFEEQLKHIIIDLFSAGTETSSSTVRWALPFMLHHPEIQTKVQQEIDEVVGRERLPNMTDRIDLPYTVATLQEVERVSCVVGNAIPKSNNKPIEFHGYKIPPGSFILLSLYSVHRDSRFWDEPDRFNPSRFIGADGKVFRPPHLIPFGTGKRMCPGESLARMEIFLYFSILLQKFRFKSVDGEALPSLKPQLAVVRGSNDYKLCCIPRD